MRTICLYFQIHQPFRLKRYRFFNIGNDHYYYDDYLNESIISRVAERSFLQANKVIGQRIKQLFNQEPKVFRNTELVYSDKIGADVAEMGFTAMLAEGAKHVLGWKSPNYLYCNSVNPRLKILLRNFSISDDI